jgi:hypothetical protein
VGRRTGLNVFVEGKKYFMPLPGCEPRIVVTIPTSILSLLSSCVLDYYLIIHVTWHSVIK